MLSHEEYIERVTLAHKGRYQYDKTKYMTSRGLVTITCHVHGDFAVPAGEHLYKLRGCPACAGRGKFSDKAKRVHGDRYDYSRVNYIGAQVKVEIVCREHGSFWQLPSNHLSGSGCPACNEYRPKNLSYYLSKAHEIHGDKYDYSLASYTRANDLTTIVCPIHGEFSQTWHQHVVLKHGCRSCGSGYNKVSQLDYLRRAEQQHGSRYSYPGKYVDMHTPVEISCDKHGVFLQAPLSHLSGSGCPRCRTIISKPHSNLVSFVTELVGEENVLVNDRLLLDGLEVDIYIPEKKVAIEIDGLYWHSAQFRDKSYHQHKQDLCRLKGVRLVQFWDKEVKESTELVNSMVVHALGATNLRIGARTCNLVTVTSGEYREFLTANHIQGAIPSKHKVGLRTKDGILVSVLGATTRSGRLTIDRFANLKGTIVSGGFSKLLSGLKFRDIYTHSANRYATGNLYKSTGFKLVNSSPYTLYYTDGTNLFSRNKFQKHRLTDFTGYDDARTADEILSDGGIYPIYAAGTKTWKLSV